MNEFEAFEIIKKQLCKEVIQIAESIQKSSSMSTQDLDKLEKIYTTKEKMLRAVELEEIVGEIMGEGNQNGNSFNGNGMSGYRGRAANGRFVSRESGNNSYSNGYANGYSEAMSQANNSRASYADGYDRGYSEAMNSHNMMPNGPRRW